MRDFGMDEDAEMNPRDMETMSMAACLNRIMIKVRRHNYNEESVESLKEDFAYVGEKFGICPEEAALLSYVLEKSNDFCRCDDGDLADFLGCTNIEFISFRKYLQSLAQKRIVRIGKNRSGDATYQVMPEACEAIVNDTAFSEKSFAGLSTEEMFTEFRKLFIALRNDEIGLDILLSDINMLVDANPQNDFCQKVLECGIRQCTASEQRIFIYLCHHYVSWGEKEIEFRHLTHLTSDNEDEQRFFRFFQAEKHAFQKRGLVRFGGEGDLMDKRSAALTEKVRDTFFTEVELFCEETAAACQDVMSSESIKEKQMFYNAPEQAQVERLESLLEDTHFKGIQDRLEEMGLRKGFNIIFYGGPGTGKTETTLQLARKTGRDVFTIDVSKLKSKWVGESEKAVKGIFQIYRDLCKKKEKMPILFFNEADAIFGKRMENVESSAAQMLNTLQNILLQELETIEGILICTTNLHQNLDPAFERRFIYKVELEKPGEEVRSKIWAAMMKGYTEEEYALLGRKYPFSGGQIENVVRKSMVDYILTGNWPTIEDVCKFCDEEIFTSKVKKVGF
jgi:hypothetical protein